MGKGVHNLVNISNILWALIPTKNLGKAPDYNGSGISVWSWLKINHPQSLVKLTQAVVVRSRGWLFCREIKTLTNNWFSTWKQREGDSWNYGSISMSSVFEVRYHNYYGGQVAQTKLLFYKTDWYRAIYYHESCKENYELAVYRNYHQARISTCHKTQTKIPSCTKICFESIEKCEYLWQHVAMLMFLYLQRLSLHRVQPRWLYCQRHDRFCCYQS